jgi:hypothetical protein
MRHNKAGQFFGVKEAGCAGLAHGQVRFLASVAQYAKGGVQMAQVGTHPGNTGFKVFYATRYLRSAAQNAVNGNVCFHASLLR